MIFINNFLKMMFCVFLMFVLPVIMGDDLKNIVVEYNNPANSKSPMYHVLFWVAAAFMAALWVCLWIIFKKAEKFCIDYRKNKNFK